MKRNLTPQQTAPELQAALDWLAEPPAEDPLHDLVPLRIHLAAIGRLGLPVLHLIKIDELLQARAERIEAALIPLLLDVKLPLPIALGTIAQGLVGLRAELGETWLTLAREGNPDELAKVKRSGAQNCLNGVRNLYRQFLTVVLIAIPIPVGFWRNLQALRRHAQDSLDPASTLPVEIGAIESLFKAMLALTAAQPEGLTAREIAFLAEYLETHAGLVRVDPVRPEKPGDWFWLDAALDQPPVPLERLQPDQSDVVYFRFAELGKQAAHDLDQLNEGTPPRALGLPLQAAGADYRNALERARKCWMSPRRRSFSRRAQSLPVEVCSQMGALWNELAGVSLPAPKAVACEMTHTEWTMMNEGPSGYAIAHVIGAVSGIVAGGAVGLRTGPGAGWQICLVRWARSRNSQHVEMGLEVLSPKAFPVRIQALGNRGAEAPVPALLLPALPGIQRGESILAGRGDYNARPFTLLTENDGHLQIAECMPHRSLIETSSVEVFEFIRSGDDA